MHVEKLKINGMSIFLYLSCTCRIFGLSLRLYVVLHLQLIVQQLIVQQLQQQDQEEEVEENVHDESDEGYCSN